MSKKVKITLTTEHTETVTVANDVKLEPLVDAADESDFIVIPTLNGGEYVFRKGNILSMVKEGREDSGRSS